MDRPSDAALIAAAEAAAEVAAAVVRPFFRSGISADLKGDESPVTIADRAAEQAMRAVISARFPEHGILGEEHGLERGSARLRWVLDPIDGTRAFITGRAMFATLIGLLDDGVPVLGLVDQPMTRERWLGVAGRRTTFRGPLGGVAGTRACPDIAAAELSATSPQMFDADQTTRWRRLEAAVRRTTFGGDAYAYGLLALGQIDLIAEADLKVWDWAALAPVIEGAGGKITDWDGRPLRGLQDGSSQQGPVLAAGDTALHDRALTLLHG